MPASKEKRPGPLNSRARLPPNRSVPSAELIGRFSIDDEKEEGIADLEEE
jgi:hypothetical protein